MKSECRFIVKVIQTLMQKALTFVLSGFHVTTDTNLELLSIGMSEKHVNSVGGEIFFSRAMALPASLSCDLVLAERQNDSSKKIIFSSPHTFEPPKIDSVLWIIAKSRQTSHFYFTIVRIMRCIWIIVNY